MIVIAIQCDISDYLRRVVPHPGRALCDGVGPIGATKNDARRGEPGLSRGRNPSRW
jgi:hypothetical protein